MTATYIQHLEDPQRDTFAACGLIVIDGEYSSDGGERALQRMQQMNMPQGSDKFGRGYHQVKGHPLVAPEDWRILTEPCDRCDRGRVVSDADMRAYPCGLCVDGHRVVIFTALAPCVADGGWREVVTLGRFTIPALLPVVAKPSDSPDKACIVPLTRGMVLHWTDRPCQGVERDSEMIGPLDPLPRPGQFIARPERVA